MTKDQWDKLSPQSQWDQHCLLLSELNGAEAELALYKSEPQRGDVPRTVQDAIHDTLKFYQTAIDGDFDFVEPPANEADTRKLDMSGSLPHR